VSSQDHSLTSIRKFGDPVLRLLAKPIADVDASVVNHSAP